MGARGPVSKVNKTAKPKLSAAVPSAPSHLDAVAKKEYGRIVKELSAQEGYLQSVDLAVLSMYAQAYSDTVRLTLLVRDEGETLREPGKGAQQNPNFWALNTAKKDLKDTAAKLGFSPIDRERITAKTEADTAGNRILEARQRNIRRRAETQK